MSTVLSSFKATARKLRPYPEYGASCAEWLGQIPAHWQVKKLKFIANVNMGQSPASEECNSNGIGSPFLQGNAEFGPVHPNAKYYCPSPGKFALPGDFLLSVRAPVGAVNAADRQYGIGRGLCAITPNTALVEHAFTCYLLHVVRVGLHGIATGSTYDAVSVDQIENMNCIVPPRPEQLSIAAFLDRETAKIDALIAKRQQLIALLEEKRAALTSRAVTKGLDPSVSTKDSGVDWLGKVPVHWEVKRVKYLARILRGKFTHRPRNDPRLYDGPHPFIQTGDVARANKYIKEYHQTLNEEGFKVSKQFPKGTLVMTIAANIGDMAILDFEACFPDSIVGFVPNPGIYLDYLFSLFVAMRQELLSIAPENTQLNLNVERLGSIPAPLPPFEEQRQIADHIEGNCSSLLALEENIKVQIERLHEYRTALISAAVTGKINVRGEIK